MSPPHLPAGPADGEGEADDGGRRDGADHPASPLAANLAANLATVQARIEAACSRVERDSADVRIVAVTKSVGSETARELARLGLEDLGENRVAELEAKRAALDPDPQRPRWHLIGHLQSRKIGRALRLTDVLHAGDRWSLLAGLDAALERVGGSRRLDVLVQVNVSGEHSKGGFPPSDVPAMLQRARDLARLRVTGLMTMAPATDDPETVRPVFRRLRELRDAAHDRGYLEGRELSMGMSSDFGVAVEEGATLVRLGRILVTDHPGGWDPPGPPTLDSSALGSGS